MASLESIELHTTRASVVSYKLEISSSDWSSPGISSSGGQAKPNTTEVNRPQLDQLERLTISFIRSHVGSITYFLGRDPLPLKEPLITGFLFDVDLIPQNVTTATSSK